MDFFESQDTAKKNSGRLVLLFSIAVVLIAVINTLLISGVLHFKVPFFREKTFVQVLLHPKVLLYGLGGTIILIGMVSLIKVLELSRGGSVVASSLGGESIDLNTTDPDERKVLNIVEEMSIASGVPVPGVYILRHENAINAFAAGNSIDDAVIGVTRGCITLLDRDELQGVVAHEFSHILNGDMKLSLRLMGWVHGILFLTILGRLLMEGGWYSSASYSSRKRSGDSHIGVMLAGVALMAIGFLGVFFGKWIKAAISREREFLADAAAVQFTRNPDGIAGALKKIAGYSKGSEVRHHQAEEVSHLFFGEGVERGLVGMFATHPPLEKRIKAILPNWDGNVAVIEERDSMGGAYTDVGASGFGGGYSSEVLETAAEVLPIEQPTVSKAAVTQVIDHIGNPDAQSMNRASSLLAAIPEGLKTAAHELMGARALVYGLLLSDDEAAKEKQLAELGRIADVNEINELNRLMGQIATLDQSLRLPLIDISVAALRMSSASQYKSFRRLVKVLIESDQQLDLFEYTIQKILTRHLDSHFTPTKRKAVQIYAIDGVKNECQVLLSALAGVGHEALEEERRAFDAGATQIRFRSGTPIQLQKDINLLHIDKALNGFAAVSPRVKRDLLVAAAHTVAADGYIEQKEMELLRAIADSLECPMALV